MRLPITPKYLLGPRDARNYDGAWTGRGMPVEMG